MKTHMLNGFVRILYSTLTSILIMLSMVALTLGPRPAEAAPFAYVTGSDSNGLGIVSVIDIATNTVVSTIPVGTAVNDVAITPNATRAYVGKSDGTLAVIDTITNTVVSTIPVGTTEVSSIAITPAGTRAYVTMGDGSIAIIDTAINTVVSTIPSGIYFFGEVAFTPAGTRAYAAMNSTIMGPAIGVINTITNTVVSSIPMKGIARNVDITPDGTRVYVTRSGGPAVGGNTVAVIDTITNSVQSIINHSFRCYSADLAIAPDGTRAYELGSSQFCPVVFVIDTLPSSPNYNTVVTSIGVGPAYISRRGLAINPDGTRVYVTRGDGTVVVIDTASNTVLTGAGLPIAVGASANKIAITRRPTNKDQCKSSGWKAFAFKNQGQCIQYVNTGK